MTDLQAVHIEFSWSPAEQAAQRRSTRRWLTGFCVVAVAAAAPGAFLIASGAVAGGSVLVALGAVAAWFPLRLALTVRAMRRKVRGDGTLGRPTPYRSEDAEPAVHRYRFDQSGLHALAPLEVAGRWEDVERVNLEGDPIDVHLKLPKGRFLVRAPRRAFDDATLARFTELVDHVRPRFINSAVEAAAKRDGPRPVGQTLLLWIVLILCFAWSYSHFASNVPRREPPSRPLH